MYLEQLAALIFVQLFLSPVATPGSSVRNSFFHQEPSGQLFLSSCLFSNTTSSFPLPPALMPQTCSPMSHVPLPLSLARSQPAPTLSAATKAATLEHSLSHGSSTQMLEPAEALPAGSPIFTRASGKFSIKKC